MSISSELTHIGLMGMALNGICKRFPDDVGWKVELSVIEAITNSIKYACQHDPDKRVDVCFSFTEDRLEVRISDNGIPGCQVWQSEPTPTTTAFEAQHATNHTQLPESGRGLGLIYSLMDEVVFQTESGLNQLMLSKKISG